MTRNGPWPLSERRWRALRGFIDIPRIWWMTGSLRRAERIFHWWVWYGGKHSVWHKSRGIDD